MTASQNDAGAEGAAEGGSVTYKLQWLVVLGAGPAGDAAAGDAAAAAAEAGADAGSAATQGDGGGDGGGPSQVPIPGVEVCVYQDSSIPCVTSASDGTFTLAGLPGGKSIAVTLNKTGYVPTLLAIATARTDMDGRANPIFLDSRMAPLPNVGVTIDSQTKGQIAAFAIGPAPDGGNGFPTDPGAQIALSPASGNGPFYQNSQGQYDTTLTGYQGFVAAFFNVTPGTYTITYTDTKNDCEPINFPFGGWGYPVTTPAHSLQLPVVAGYTTGLVGALCTPNSTIVSVDGG